MVERKGRIIIEQGANVWPHELRTAEALVVVGYVVRFIKKSEAVHQHSADAYLNDVLYEMKSPTGAHLSVVSKNLKKAMRQSCCIVFDSVRMRNVRDVQVLKELEKQISLNRKIRSLLFVDKKREVTRLK